MPRRIPRHTTIGQRTAIPRQTSSRRRTTIGRHTPIGRHTTIGVLVGILAGASGCDAVSGLFTRAPTSEHARYVEALSEVDLSGAPHAAAWIGSADSALANADRASLPVRLEGWFDEESPRAIAVRLSSPSSRWMAVRARLVGAAPGRLFVDAFEMPREPDESPGVLATAADSAVDLAVRVRGDDDIVVRLQPELLRGGAWTLDVTTHDEEPFDDATQ